jgi:MFS family permease
MPRFIEQVRAVPNEISTLPKAVKGIAFVVFIYALSWGMVLPFISIFFLDVLGSYSAVALITAMLALLRVIWIFPLGEILDRFSQKKILRFMLLLYIPMWPLLASLQTFFHATIYQFYHSFLAAGWWSSTETYTRNHSPKGRKSESWGLFDTGWTVALIFGAIVGGLLLEHLIGMRVLFLTIPPVLMLLAYFAAHHLPENTETTNTSIRERLASIDWKRIYINSIINFWKNPGLRRLWIFVLLTGFLAVSQGVLLPLLAHAAGASFIEIGLVYGLFMLPLILEAPFSVLADRWSSRFLLVFGFFISAVSLLCLLWAESLPLIFLLSFLIGTALAMITPTVSGMASDFMPEGKTGAYNSVYNATYGLGGALGLLGLGLAADSAGINSTYILSATVMFSAFVLAFFFWRFKTDLAEEIIDGNEVPMQPKIVKR